MNNTKKITKKQQETLSQISDWTTDVDRRSAEALVRRGLAETRTDVVVGQGRQRTRRYVTAYRAR